MLATPIRALIARVRHLLILLATLGPAHTVQVSGRRYAIGRGCLLPVIAGGAPDDDEDDGENDGDAEGDDARGDVDDADTGDDGDRGDDAEDGDDDEGARQTVDDLPEWAQKIVKSARRAERQARRDAAKARKQAGRPAGDGRDDGRPARPADDGAKPDAGTAKLQRANLLLALADKGYNGAQARMVARLLDDVDYDDSDQPTNLDDVLEEAQEVYGDALGTPRPAKPKAPKTDGAAGSRKSGKPPALTADELKVAKACGMTADEYRAYKDPQHRPADKAG